MEDLGYMHKIKYERESFTVQQNNAMNVCSFK